MSLTLPQVSKQQLIMYVVLIFNFTQLYLYYQLLKADPGKHVDITWSNKNVIGMYINSAYNCMIYMYISETFSDSVVGM